jgi:L-alanine-DL-glutamate epimerase-like enolase superfamily enzyme
VKIDRREILRVPPSWVWLKIHTDGHVGLGEPYLENHA